MTVSTQTRHPWRATTRTVFAAVVALLSLLPTIALAADVDQVPLIAQGLVIAAAVTRVLAIPGVDAFLRQYLPWLASAPVDASDEPAAAPLPPRTPPPPTTTTFRGDDFR